MKFRTGYLYHLITAIIFVLLALYLWMSPGFLGGIRREMRQILIVVLLLWAVFRITNAWFAYQRSKRKDNDA